MPNEKSTLKDLKYYVDIAKQMESDDTGRDALFNYIDSAEKCLWDLPREMAELGWLHKVVSTEAMDAIRTGTRMLSGTRPRYKFMPLANNTATKKSANEMERMIGTLMQKASRRNQVSIERDASFCALKYDCVAVQVDYLPYQKKIAKDWGIGNETELEMAERQGPFVVKFMNPKSVHVRYSRYGLSAVLYTYRQKLIDIRECWGEGRTLIDGREPTTGELYTYYTVYDYTDKLNRVVWFNEDHELIRKEHGLPFMPWAVKAGGTNIEEDSKYTYQPLLASMARSESWETINILETLGVSGEIRKASKPAGKKIGPNPESVTKDYTDPSQDVLVPPGHDYQALPVEPADNEKFNISDRMINKFKASAVPQVLQDAQMPSNTAFAAINTVVQIASSVLKPHKELAENAIADIATLMLNWIHFMKEPIAFTGEGLYKIGPKTNDAGVDYVLSPEYYDPKELNIVVELDAEKPLDKQQLINTGIMAHRDLRVPLENALETAGYEDPEMLVKQYYIEELFNTFMEAEKQKILGKVANELQAEAQALVAQSQPVETPTQQTPTTSGDLLNNELMNANTGEGFNPGMGGQPPAEVNPSQTFEGQNGMDRSGGGINGL